MALAGAWQQALPGTEYVLLPKKSSMGNLAWLAVERISVSRQVCL